MRERANSGRPIIDRLFERGTGQLPVLRDFGVKLLAEIRKGFFALFDFRLVAAHFRLRVCKGLLAFVELVRN